MRRSIRVVVLFVLLVFVLFLVSCELFEQPSTPEPTATATATQEGDGQPPDNGETATPTATQESPDNGATVTPSPTQESPDNGATVTPSPTQESDGEMPPAAELIITNPAEGDAVFSPAVISGTVSQMPFESQMTAQVLDANGGVIAEGIIMATPDDETDMTGSGTFSGTLPFTVNAVVEGGMVRVFDESAGPESSIVMSDTVSVTLAPEGITIVEPAEDDTVFTPVQVTGFVSTRPFEANLRGRVYDGNGNVVGEGPIMVTPVGDQIWGPGTFDATIPFSITVAGPGMVEVADISAEDGSVIVSDTVDVTLAIGPK